MDVLISTVGISLVTNLIHPNGPLTADDGDVLIQHKYAKVASKVIDDILVRVATYLRRNPDVCHSTDELIAVRKYVQRMTRRTHIILPHTDYILLAPNTVLGRFCAEQLKSVICTNIVDAYVTIIYIEGLQLHDSRSLDHGWENLRNALDHIYHRYKSDVVYNVTGDFILFSGLIYGYATNRGARIIYTFDSHSPLVIIDVNPTGTPTDILFYQDVPTVV